MEQDRLSDKEMWQGLYSEQKDGRFWPFPDKRCSAFELDRVYQKYLPRGKDITILEMGCGGSKWLPYFSKVFGYKIYGVDYTQEGCRSALLNLQKVGGTGDIFCKDFAELGEHFKGRYDLVISLGVVEHFSKPNEIIGMFSDCLRGGGVIITFVPNLSGIMGTLLKRLDWKLYDTHNIFRLPELVEYHKMCGLELVHASYLEFADFSCLPLEQFPKVIMLILKNLIYLMNRGKLLLYKWLGLNPQSAYLCAAMIVLARRPATSGSPLEHEAPLFHLERETPSSPNVSPTLP